MWDSHACCGMIPLEVGTFHGDQRTQHACESGTAAVTAVAAKGVPGDPRGAGGGDCRRRRSARPGGEADADAPRPQPGERGLRQARHQARRSAARQPPSAPGATGGLSRPGPLAARGDTTPNHPRRLGRLRAGPRLARAARGGPARRPGHSGLRGGPPAQPLQQSAHASPLPGPSACGVARDVLAHPHHRRGLPRAVVPGGRALRVGLDRTRAEPGQVPARRRRLGVHHGALPARHADAALPRVCPALAPAVVPLWALPGAPLPARAGPPAPGARAELRGPSLPEAPQGPVAARDLTAARRAGGAARGEALRAADEAG